MRLYMSIHFVILTMIYQDTIEFAESLDAKDELKHLRDEFLIPRHNGEDAIYLCGNSLGLQPKKAAEYLNRQLGNWHQLAVEGWFEGDDPWLLYHQKLRG